jgi:hypothetical protein
MSAMEQTREERKATLAARAADGVVAMAQYRALEQSTRANTERLRAERLARGSFEVPQAQETAKPRSRKSSQRQR